MIFNFCLFVDTLIGMHINTINKQIQQLIPMVDQVRAHRPIRNIPIIHRTVNIRIKVRMAPIRMNIIHNMVMVLNKLPMSTLKAMVIRNQKKRKTKSNYFVSFCALVYGSGYEYGNYYPSTNAGTNNSTGENVNGQQSGNSPSNPTDYDHENYYGKTKTSIVPSPTYHPYSRN